MTKTEAQAETKRAGLIYEAVGVFGGIEIDADSVSLDRRVATLNDLHNSGLHFEDMLVIGSANFLAHSQGEEFAKRRSARVLYVLGEVGKKDTLHPLTEKFMKKVLKKHELRSVDDAIDKILDLYGSQRVLSRAIGLTSFNTMYFRDSLGIDDFEIFDYGRQKKKLSRSKEKTKILFERFISESLKIADSAYGESFGGPKKAREFLELARDSKFFLLQTVFLTTLSSLAGSPCVPPVQLLEDWYGLDFKLLREKVVPLDSRLKEEKLLPPNYWHNEWYPNFWKIIEKKGLKCTTTSIGRFTELGKTARSLINKWREDDGLLNIAFFGGGVIQPADFGIIDLELRRGDSIRNYDILPPSKLAEHQVFGTTRFSGTRDMWPGSLMSVLAEQVAKATGVNYEIVLFNLAHNKLDHADYGKYDASICTNVVDPHLFGAGKLNALEQMALSVRQNGSLIIQGGYIGLYQPLLGVHGVFDKGGRFILSHLMFHNGWTMPNSITTLDWEREQVDNIAKQINWFEAVRGKKEFPRPDFIVRDTGKCCYYEDRLGSVTRHLISD